MRLRTVLSLATAGVLSAAAPAAADYPHVVAAGETLTSVAAADGLTVAQLAAANGISPFTQIVSGTTLMIPPQGASTGVTSYVSASGTDGDGDNDGDAGSSAASATGGSYVVQPGDTLSAIAAHAGVSVASLAAANGLDPNAALLSGTTLSLSGSAAPASTSSTVSTASTTATGSSGGSYVVQPGDTLSAIAARAGVSVASLAAANGVDPNGVLLSGSVLALAGSSSSSGIASAVSSQPIGAAAEGATGGPPYPTPEVLSSSEVGSIASANGVSPAFAAAIGYQESGFNNDLVSSAGAVGVMQILPGTWDWIDRTLTAGTALNPASATDNVRAGSMMLHSLLAATGGSQSLAAAGYYQGLASVQQNGMYTDTQQYVNNVLALESRFGGG
ncbi:MAG TPA: LysM peptidoglycan-binding domain-containing protein [Solirubrobacteraceae bacterium]|nr:LysM peptidoglycan-binding domain-containing protein [Solirubrobacteraceae bacterium]